MLKVLPGGTVGAQVQGVDLASLSSEQVDAIEQALHRTQIKGSSAPGCAQL